MGVSPLLSCGPSNAAKGARNGAEVIRSTFGVTVTEPSLTSLVPPPN